MLLFFFQERSNVQEPVSMYQQSLQYDSEAGFYTEKSGFVTATK